MKFKKIFNGTLHFVEGTKLYASRGNKIFSCIFGEPFRLFARLPIGEKDSFFCKYRIFSRLFRSMIHHIIPFRNFLVVFGFGKTWCLDSQNGNLLFPPSPYFGSRPLAVCSSPDGIYYGEYGNNPQRASVKIFFSRNGNDFAKILEIKKVRHIHGIFYDGYTGLFWMTTGDRNDESSIWVSKDKFQSVQPILSGSQQTRAIQILFDEKFLYYGTDTPEETNSIYRVDRATMIASKVINVSGSVFHASRCSEYFLFSTAVEPSNVNDSKYANLYVSEDGHEWKILSSHKKDIYPKKLFQYGQLILPKGNNCTRHFFYSAFAVDSDNSIFLGDINGFNK